MAAAAEFMAETGQIPLLGDVPWPFLAVLKFFRNKWGAV
jgi:hypothetical protein